MFQTALSLISTVLLAVLIVLLLKFKRELPDIQQVLDDVGASISEQLGDIFAKPAVSKAMSVLGQKSGEVRANKALRNKAAEGLLARFPSAKFILDQLDITPIEGLQLMNDPIVGPMIQGALQKGLSGLSKGFGSGASQSRPSGELGKV